MQHYHFVWDCEFNTLHGPVQINFVGLCSPKNFPVRCFYSAKSREVHLFYRQGQNLLVSIDNKLEYIMNQIMDRELS